MQDYQMNVRLSPPQKAALDEIIQRERTKAPLKIITQSDVIRQLIIDAYYRCPQCDSQTIPHPDPKMVGVPYCPHCQESISYAPDNGADSN